MSEKEAPFFVTNDQTWEDYQKTMNVVGTVRTALPNLVSHLLLDAFDKVEEQGLRVNAIFMNAVVYADVRKWRGHDLDIETERVNLVKGIMAMTWGALIVVTRKMPHNTIAIVSDDESATMSVLMLGEKTVPEAEKLIMLYSSLELHAEAIRATTKEMRDIVTHLVSVVES